MTSYVLRLSALAISDDRNCASAGDLEIHFVIRSSLVTWFGIMHHPQERLLSPDQSSMVSASDRISRRELI